MNNRILTTLLLTVFPSVSLAACPEAGDLQNGIRIDFEDGTIIEYSEKQPGIIEEVEISPEDGALYYIVTERGILEIENYGRASASDEIRDYVRYEYDFDTSLVFPLLPGKNGNGKLTEYDENDEKVEEAHILYGVGTLEEFRIGSCLYEAYPVQVNMKYAGSDPLVIQLAHLNDLGIAVVKGYYELGYDPVLYAPIGIELSNAK